jgi:GPH family glycoside/pentoside/hexuronide:cation symporter
LGWSLAGVGYESKAASQSTHTITGIVVLFTLVPAVGHLTLIAIARLYRLDDDRCDAIRTEMDMRATVERSSRGQVN